MPQAFRIAVIAGQLVVGGSEKQLHLWLSHLDREKFDPVVLTLHPGHNDYWEKPIEDSGIPLHRIPHRKSRVLRLVDVIKVLNPCPPRLIHGWHLFASPYAALAAKWLGAKSLGSVRGTYQTFSDQPLAANLTLYFTDAILANSKSTASQLLTARKRKSQRIYEVQNAVEENFIERNKIRGTLVEQFGLSPQNIWIGSISRLDPKKHFDLLLKGFSLLKEKVKGIHFLLVGDGPEKERLINITKELGIEKEVTFTGEIPMANTWLKALDIFCFTSADEGLPNVIMEAAAAGLPIVTWRLPFYEELLENRKTALLVEPGDVAGLKNALLELIQSPELRNQLGQAARRHVLEGFSTERYIQKMTGVYQEILAGKSPSSTGEP